MGVQGLWRVLEPTAKPVQLGNLRGKVLAIDASIWIYHFLKAMRDSKGTILAAAHIIGFFRRICKLLFFEIRPVFVFDGAPPLLKKQTTQKRGERRQGREVNARATANKLLTLQLQRAAQQENSSDASAHEPEVRGTVPADAVYMDQVNGSANPSGAPRADPANFVRMDQYHLPELSKIAPVNANDQRMLTEEELQEYSRDFSAQARAGFIDTSTVDFHSPEFQRLPIETQYQLLNMARLKSRLRMGYTAEELEQMFPDEMDFSRFQINRVAQRNFFTQRLMNLVGLEDDLTRRVSSEKNKEYMLKRNEEGWTLSLEDSTKGDDEKAAEDEDQAPDLNASIQPEHIKEEVSDDEFEDVDIEPVPESAAAQDHAYTDDSDKNMDLSAEDSARLDELFGFEAKLSREDLYNKMMQAVSANANDHSDEAGQSKGSINKDWKPRSFLFGSSNERKQEGAKPAPLRSQNLSSINAKAAGQESQKTQAAPLPWFEKEGDKFEEMRIQSKHEDPNLIPYEEIQNLVDSEEDESDNGDAAMHEVEVSREGSAQQQHSTDEPTKSVSPSLAGSVEISSSDRTDVAGLKSDAHKVGSDSGELETDGPAAVEKGVKIREPIDAAESDNAGSPVEPPVVQAEPEVLATSLEVPPPAEPPAEPLMDTITPSEPTNPESPKPADPAKPAEPEQPVSAKPDAETDVPRPSNLGTASTQTLTQEAAASEPEPLSPEAAERAEEEARAAVDEDEDIAAMLIAEAEENERFAKELAEQSHKAWTEADQLDYNAQINTLRSQFAKETRDADTVTQEMVQECQELLQYFGIPYITAPGEAEAQCAELRHLKLVDGVVTDDGDTFLFDDDTVVYRNMFSQSRFVECYTTRQIRDKLGLDRRSLIDLAFLLGSDYTEGILGIGPVTGVEILAEFGSLEEFAKWWNVTQRFPDSADLDTRLRRRLVKQFGSKWFLPEEFPSKAVVDAYLHPVVDKDATKFNWAVPDIDGLRKFMSVAAGWSIEKINMALLPVVQEAKRRELQQKTGAALSQSRLDDYYSTVVQNPELRSKRAAKATTALRKRAKK